MFYKHESVGKLLFMGFVWMDCHVDMENDVEISKIAATETMEGDLTKQGYTDGPQRVYSTSSLSSLDDEPYASERSSAFDLLSNIGPTVQKVRRRGERLKDSMLRQKDKVLSKQEGDYQKYRQRFANRFDKVLLRWQNEDNVSLREKVSFMSGVVNIFCTAMIIGGYPKFLHIWYTALLGYFMPLRFYTSVPHFTLLITDIVERCV